MEFNKIVSVSISFLVSCLFQQPLAASPGSTREPCKILFIGSSYFNGNDLPGLFGTLADSAGREVYVDRQITSGFYLDDHANSSSTEEKINEEDWDYVVLQGVGSITAYPEIFTDHPVLPALITLRDKIFNNCESTKMVFCLPWAFEDGMTWLEGWTDTYEEMQFKIYVNTLQYSDAVGFVIAPVGWAWNTVLREKNYPLHYLHLSDWNHPSLKGSYLMACTIFSTVFLEGSTDINYTGGLPEDDAKYFQAVASGMVLDSLQLWNIPITHTELNESSIPGRHHLYQNYPNPFNPVTDIQYFLPEKSDVRVRIYNVLGELVGTHVEVEQEPQTHSFTWDASSLPGGIYFYRLTAGSFTQTRKMLLIR